MKALANGCCLHLVRTSLPLLTSGPSHYAHGGDQPATNSWQRASANFASTSRRLYEPPSIVTSIPPPGSYEVADSYRSTQGRYYVCTVCTYVRVYVHTYIRAGLSWEAFPLGLSTGQSVEIVLSFVYTPAVLFCGIQGVTCTWLQIMCKL